MMYIAIALTLLALVAGTHLLYKVKADAMGGFSRWIAYSVIIISIGMLLCELGRTGMRIMNYGGEHEMKGHHMGMMQYCPPEMCGGVACMIPMGGSGMDCCKGENDDKCCEEGDNHGSSTEQDSLKAGK